VETHRLSRAIVLAAAVAAGSAASSTAQTGGGSGDPSVNVAAPRAADMSQPLSPFSVIPDPVQSAGFHTSLTSTPGAAVTIAAPPEASAPIPSSKRSEPADGTATLPMPTPIPANPAFMAPSAAPAWRWHGYGAVATGEALPPAAPRGPTTFDTTPAGSAVLAIPTGPETSLGTDWRQPGAVPAFGARAEVPPLPAAATPQPLSANEPAWKSLGERVTLGNPMSASRDAWQPPSAILTVSATAPAWRPPAVTLDPPQVAAAYTAKPADSTPIRPVSYAVPAPAPRAEPPHVSSAVRRGIERVCAGRGRDLDVVVRGPTNLLVRLKVRYPADAEYLANAISRMPELAPYQVQFEMQVAK
jgi:hypothetical protein